MNHDMRVGSIVFLREYDVVGVEGFRRRLSAGHTTDIKKRPWLVTATDSFGMALAGLTLGDKRFRGSFVLPPGLRVGQWDPNTPAQRIRDLRRAAVVRWGSAASYLISTPPRPKGYNLGPIGTALARAHREMKVPLAPRKLWDSIHE